MKLTFNPDSPSSMHDELVRCLIRCMAETMLEELHSHKLSVVLIPQKQYINHGGMIRVVEDKNPNWYSELFRDVTGYDGQGHNKAGGCSLRKRVIKALQKIIGGTDSAYSDSNFSQRFKNQSRLRQIAFERLYYGFTSAEGEYFSPSPMIQEIYDEPA